MTIWEKVSNIRKKKFNSELMYNKKVSKIWKRFITRKSFPYFYIPVILLDSIYRKDENYYPKVFLEEFINKFLGKLW